MSDLFLRVMTSPIGRALMFALMCLGAFGLIVYAIALWLS